MLGFPILYCKGMRIVMFQLSGFCSKLSGTSPETETMSCVALYLRAQRRFLDFG